MDIHLAVISDGMADISGEFIPATPF
jgi:hypothetical protein